MNKELEEIKDDKLRIGLLGLKRVVEANAKKMTKDEIIAFDFTFMNITKALLELQAIKTAKPSEALDCIDYIENKLGDLKYEYKRTQNHRCDDLFIQEQTFTTIKHALLKSLEQEKVLNELIMLINDIEPTFNRNDVSSDTDILGTIIRDYFIDNASDLLKKYLENRGK